MVTEGNLDFSKEVAENIEKDMHHFFEIHKTKQDNWAFYKWTSVDQTCLEYAVAHGSENVVEQLFQISTLTKENKSELTSKYLPQALQAYRKSDEERHQDQGEGAPKRGQRHNIIKLLIKNSANPFDKENRYLRDVVQYNYDSLIRGAFESEFPVNLEVMLELFFDASLDAKRNKVTDAFVRKFKVEKNDDHEALAKEVLQEAKKQDPNFKQDQDMEALPGYKRLEEELVQYFDKLYPKENNNNNVTQFQVVPLEEQSVTPPNNSEKKQEAPSCWSAFFRKLNFCGSKNKYQEVDKATQDHDATPEHEVNRATQLQ